jgi:two-component sensor histidine kinase
VRLKPAGELWRRVSIRARLVLGLSAAVAPALLLAAAPWILTPPGRALYWEVGLFGLGCVLAVFGIRMVVDREILRWIADLRSVAGATANGSAEGAPPSVRSAPGEISGIGAALRNMADAIAARDLALRDSLLERDDLLREIHHRVRNNLQVISSLLSLQQRALSDPAARAAMSDARQRISALALIYRALYEGPDLRRVDLRAFLEELIAQLVMHESGAGLNIRTDFAIDDATIDPDHLAPLALFAVEAITNAKKHGLAATGGRLAVTFRVCGPTAELSVTDSGLPDRAPPVVGEGVGRTLMLAFARQLGGDVDFSPTAAGGMTVRLAYPTPVAPPAQ